MVISDTIVLFPIADGHSKRECAIATRSDQVGRQLRITVIACARISTAAANSLNECQSGNDPGRD
jgi:hypothetical protein